jgi:hypothetical protein
MIKGRRKKKRGIIDNMVSREIHPDNMMRKKKGFAAIFHVSKT